MDTGSKKPHGPRTVECGKKKLCDIYRGRRKLGDVAKAKRYMSPLFSAPSDQPLK